jgi:hypothetical protein
MVLPKIIFGKYAIVFYTNFGMTWQGGRCYGPVITIRPKYYGVDRGILEHELVHSRQFWNPRKWFWGTLKWEVEAYKEQLRYYADDRTERFAQSICDHYGLNVKQEDVIKLLQA